MTWIPPRRFPHGSYSEVPLDLPPLNSNMPDRYDPDVIRQAFGAVERRDAKIADALLTFHKALSAGLDWMQEQLAYAFVGVPLINQRGQLTLADTATTVSVTFPTEEVDTNYSVSLSTAGFNGAPAAGAFAVKSITKATTGFTAGFIAAPGAGTNVVYDWILVREITR